eukprot:3767-Heterococcus_DN1.PRE.1
MGCSTVVIAVAYTKQQLLSHRNQQLHAVLPSSIAVCDSITAAVLCNIAAVPYPATAALLKRTAAQSL